MPEQDAPKYPDTAEFMHKLVLAAAEKHKIRANPRALSNHLGGQAAGWGYSRVYAYYNGIHDLTLTDQNALQTQLGIKL